MASTVSPRQAFGALRQLGVRFTFPPDRDGTPRELVAEWPEKPPGLQADLLATAREVFDSNPKLRAAFTQVALDDVGLVDPEVQMAGA